ncbi:hypothetical protein FRC10_003790 [Ceratobasidium sp. 414]|nr:hypothetical protein FRC10_003790 [Ceratobasidium sp. 414]
MSDLFINKSRDAIAFFVQLDQKDGEEKELELKKKIREHGGAVVSSYQVANYVLVDPSTPTGADFIDFHTTPTRYIVSKDFIQESIDRHKLVPYSELILFVKEDRPVIFYLHESLRDADSNQLRQAILLRGGNPSGGLGNAQVVIYHTKWSGCKHVLAKPKNVIRLETHQWLESCIRRNRFSLRDTVEVRVSSSKSGRPPGRPRNEFTKKDDQYLVAWMAGHFGLSMTGRLGNRAYQDMVGIAEYHTWSTAHTWQSWRERYKKKKAVLDPLIEAYVLKHETSHSSDEAVEGIGEVGDELDQDYYKQFRSCDDPRKRQAQDSEGDDADGSPHQTESYSAGKGKVVRLWQEVDGRLSVPQAGLNKRARVGTTLEDSALRVSSRTTASSSFQHTDLQAWDTTKDKTLVGQDRNNIKIPRSDEQLEERAAMEADKTMALCLRKLSKMAEEYNLSPRVVMAQFEQVEGMVRSDKVVGATWQAIKDFIKGLRTYGETY